MTIFHLLKLLGQGRGKNMQLFAYFFILQENHKFIVKDIYRRNKFMNYENYIHNLFVDDEIFKYSINEIENQHEISFYIRFGSVLYNLNHDYGSIGLRKMVDYINSEINQDITLKEIKQIIKFFKLICHGMIISYKITFEYYKCLLKYDDIVFINSCIELANRNPLDLEHFEKIVTNKENG